MVIHQYLAGMTSDRLEPGFHEASVASASSMHVEEILLQVPGGRAASLLLTDDTNLRNAAAVSNVTAVACANLPRQPVQLWDLCTSAGNLQVGHLQAASPVEQCCVLLDAKG